MFPFRQNAYEHKNETFPTYPANTFIKTAFAGQAGKGCLSSYKRVHIAPQNVAFHDALDGFLLASNHRTPAAALFTSLALNAKIKYPIQKPPLFLLAHNHQILTNTD